MSEIDDYLALVEKRKAEQKPLELKMPSGSKWLYTAFSLESYAVSGRLPMHLASKLKSVQKIEHNLSDDEMVEIGISSLEIVRDIMLSHLLFPKITLEKTEDSITPEQIDRADFAYWCAFCMNGGQVQKKS